MNVQRFFLAIAPMAGIWFPSPVQAASTCHLEWPLLSGPVLFSGLAGTGTLVRYSDDSSDCSPVKLRFDARRSTALRLSQVNLEVGQLDAIISTLCIPSGKN